MKYKRFKMIYFEGVMNGIEIWEDTETGVNYLYRKSGNSGGLTPLLNKDGTPVVSKMEEN